MGEGKGDTGSDGERGRQEGKRERGGRGAGGSGRGQENTSEGDRVQQQWEGVRPTRDPRHVISPASVRRCCEEPPSLLCSAGNVAPFTLPAQALAYRPPPDVVVARYRNGDSERKIHLNTELTPLELERLAQLQKDLTAASGHRRTRHMLRDDRCNLDLLMLFGSVLGQAC